MAITIIGSNTGAGTALTDFTISYTSPNNITWQAGDFAIAVCNVNVNADTFSQTAGSTFTGLGAAGALQTDSSGAVTFSTLVAWRVLQAGDTAPTFHVGTSGRASWAVLIIRPDAGSTISLDVAQGPSFDGVAGTSHTPPSATAANNTDASVAILSAKANANGTTAITWTASSGWTSQVTGGQAGGASTASNFIGMATKIPVGSGSVAPAADSTNVSCVAQTANYQLLAREDAAATAPAAVTALRVPVTGPASPGGQAVFA